MNSTSVLIIYNFQFAGVLKFDEEIFLTVNASYDYTKAEKRGRNISVKVGAMVSYKSPLTYRSYQKMIYEKSYIRVAKRLKPINPTISDALPGIF